MPDRRRIARFAVTGLSAILVAGCAQRDSTPRPDFAAWAAQEDRAREVTAYARFLDARAVGATLPMSELLRSGRRWRRCGHDAFAVPPRSQWPAMVATLELVAELRAHGLIDRAQVASVYRDAAFNRCEGGSSRSRHLTNNAIDFDLAAHADNVAPLCDYWRRYGRTHRFGLGFYSDHQIHVDTSGYRTWGYDYTRRTSLCVSKTP